MNNVFYLEALPIFEASTRNLLSYTQTLYQIRFSVTNSMKDQLFTKISTSISAKQLNISSCLRSFHYLAGLCMGVVVRLCKFHEGVYPLPKFILYQLDEELTEEQLLSHSLLLSTQLWQSQRTRTTHPTKRSSDVPSASPQSDISNKSSSADTNLRLQTSPNSSLPRPAP